MAKIFFDILRSLFQRGGTAIERYGAFSNEVTEGRSSVRVEEERNERGGWIVNNWCRQEGRED